MKPFLLLATRPEDAAAESERDAFLRYGGLAPDDLRWIRVEAAPLPALDLDDYSGVIIGGSPFNASDGPDAKSALQLRVETELSGLLDEIVERDFPFLGACYGIGTLGRHQGGLIDRTYAEPVGAVTVTLTAEGIADPLLAGLPGTFAAFVGHKEACSVPPPNAVVLATSAACPVQMFRIKRNLYATQFHPELDAAGLITRIRAYRYAGYFPPEDADKLIAMAGQVPASPSSRIATNFVRRYAR